MQIEELAKFMRLAVVTLSQKYENVYIANNNIFFDDLSEDDKDFWYKFAGTINSKINQESKHCCQKCKNDG